MGYITYVYIYVLNAVLSPVCTKEDDTALKSQQVVQWDDTSNRDIQRILLGVIVLELIVIIILLLVCIKMGDGKKEEKRNEDDSSSHSSHMLPTFHLSTIKGPSTGNKSIFGINVAGSTIDGNINRPRSSSSRNVNTDENFLLQEDTQLNEDEYFRPYSDPSPSRSFSGLATGRTTRIEYSDKVVGDSEGCDSQSSKQRVKVLPRDFML